MKKTCGDLYLEAITKLETDLERRVFAKGFVSGQAEKVYLGACQAAMFRPSDTTFDFILSDVQEVCERYKLHYFVFYLASIIEIWIYRSGFQIGAWYEFAKDSPEWHKCRAIACGIPESEIDVNFHERKSYNQPCDQGALVGK